MTTTGARSDVSRAAWYVTAATVSGRFLLIFVASAVLATILVTLRSVVLPIVFAVVLAALLAPLARWLRVHRLPSTLVSLLAIALVCAVGVGAIILTSRSIIAQWDDLSRTISAGIDEIEVRAQQWLDLTADQTADTRAAMASVGGVVRRAAVSGLITIVPVVIELVSAALLTVFTLFFLLKDGPELWARILRWSSPRSVRIDQLGQSVWVTLGTFMRGTTMIAAIDAGGIGLGMWLIGVPFPGAIALLTFLLAYIPLVGATISGTFGILLALGDGGISKALAALVVVLVVQQVEGNVLQPFIMGNALRLHPLVVAVALVIGGTLAGIVGMFLAIPFTAAAAAAVSSLRAESSLEPP